MNFRPLSPFPRTLLTLKPDFFDKVGRNEGWSATFSAVQGTFPEHLFKEQPISDEEFWNKAINLHGHGIEKELNHLRSRKILADISKFHVVVISVNWWHPEFKEKALPSVLYTIDKLLQSGKKVICVHSCWSYNSNRMAETYWTVQGRGSLLSTINSEAYLKGRAFDEARQSGKSVQNLVMKRFPQVRWIDLTPYLPDNLMVDGKTVLCNTTHLNIYGGNVLADRFIASGQRFIQPRDTITAK